ncbi:hypothetical protein QZH41_012102 [Actinostola sp. cb2023]|nr:hypothetical protein QZH41_012102 [Actinostola sp. cb2023]
MPSISDSCCLHDYNVRGGDKIHLFVKKTKDSRPVPSETDFWFHLRSLLRKHFSDSDVEKVLLKYREDFDFWVKQLSLDDIERMAGIHLDEQISD